MPSAAQKQRRRKLKQKKEQKKGQNDDRIEPYVRRRIRRATESLSSNYGTSDRLIRLLEDALAAAARERPAQMPLNEEDVKLSMMAQARRASRNVHDEAVLIHYIERSTASISSATYGYNIGLKYDQLRVAAAPPPAPASPPAPAPTASASTTSSDDSESDDEAKVSDSAAPVPADSVLGRLAATAPTPPAAAPTPSDVQQGDVALADDGGGWMPVGAARGSGSDGARRVQGRRDHDRYSQAEMDRREAEAARRERERREGERAWDRHEWREPRSWEHLWARGEQRRARAQDRARRERRERREREDAAAARARAQERREVAIAQRLMAEDQSANVATPPPGPGMCNAGAVARMRVVDEAREIAEVDALAQRLAARFVDDNEEASLALAHRLMAEDAAALESARATDPRPPGLAAPPTVPPPAPAVAAPPPAPRPPPRPAPTVAAPAPAATQAARPEPPDALVCPISMELMRDPVMAMDGHTYERRNIERWLADHQTSPKTNEALPSTTLVPNHAVKSMVQDYLETCKKHHC